ncbi:MAG: hypothetical protein AAF741_05255 [Bacteroidota bacterium]
MYKFIFPLFGLLFLTTSCRQAYVAQNFEEETTDHSVVAILPYHIEYIGKLPNNWTQEREDQLRAEESVVYQRSLINQVFRRMRFQGRNSRVDLQAVATTNSRLTEAGITLSEAYQRDPEYLASVLEVDAVFQVTAVKDRQMSELASAAVEVAGDLLANLSNNPLTGLANRNQTHIIDVAIDLYDREGQVLYHDNAEIGISWRTPTNEAVEILNRRVSRTFPYRYNN